MRRVMVHWGILLYVCLVFISIGALFYLQQRYTQRLQGGGEVQWPVKLERTMAWIPSDYLTVHFMGTQTAWKEVIPPKIGDLIYVTLSVKPNGIITVEHATSIRPQGVLYILAHVTAYKEGVVNFSIPYNRVRVDLQKIDPAFYNPNYPGVLIASMKIQEGEAVITGIYSEGVPLNAATVPVRKETDPIMETGVNLMKKLSPPAADEVAGVESTRKQ